MGYDADEADDRLQAQLDEMDRYMRRFIAHHGQIQLMVVMMAYIAVIAIVLAAR